MVCTGDLEFLDLCRGVTALLPRFCWYKFDGLLEARRYVGCELLFRRMDGHAVESHCFESCGGTFDGHS